MDLLDVILFSTVHCPLCGHKEKIMMPRYASKSYYQCQRCKIVFEAKGDRCCIFCSYGDVQCPPRQEKKWHEKKGGN
jgi:hypothetical protein